jgi:hypothetical protein
LLLQAREFHEALKETRAMFSSKAGRCEYQQLAGFEGTLSQGIRRGTVTGDQDTSDYRKRIFRRWQQPRASTYCAQ